MAGLLDIGVGGYIGEYRGTMKTMINHQNGHSTEAIKWYYDKINYLSLENLNKPYLC